MGSYVDKERTEAFAKDSIKWLSHYGVPPTPENFELVFAFLSGEQPQLKTTMDGLIANGCLFEPSVMATLHQRYFRAPRDEDAVADVSEQINMELDTVLQMLETAGRDQNAYGKTLSLASGELKTGDMGAAAIKKLIDQMTSATRAMEARSTLLERQLQTSSREVNDLRERLESVRRESLTDQLTGVANRKAFDSDLIDAIEQSEEADEPLCLMMCDIDHFKVFNDTWGHQTGDQVLRLVATCLSENVKGRDTAARYGGEEFAVVLRQTDLAGAIIVADQIRGKVESKKLVKKSTGDILGVITVSCGVALYRSGESPTDFVRRADKCLYEAKSRGRNCVVSEEDSEKSASAAA